MWDLIVSVPDHCLSFHFLNYSSSQRCIRAAVQCIHIPNFNGISYLPGRKI